MKKLILAGIAVLALAVGTAGALAATPTLTDQSTTKTEIHEATTPAGETAQNGELGQAGQGGEQGQSGELAQQGQGGEQGQSGDKGESPAPGAAAPK